MPRQDGSQNGRFRLYEFYFGESEEEINTKILNSDYIAKGEQNKQDSFDGPASYIIDGDNSKFWHSKFNDNGDGHDDRPRKTDPFQFTINLGKETTFKSFAYMPRSAGVNGKFGHYEFYAAQTSEELYMKIHDKNYLAKGDFDKNSPISSFYKSTICCPSFIGS